MHGERRRALDRAEGAKEVAAMHMKNALEHLKAVERRHGDRSKEYTEALEILGDARRAFVAACDDLGALLAAHANVAG
jgi:hypothetical protein